VALLTRHLLKEALKRLGDLDIGRTLCGGNARQPASLRLPLAAHAQQTQGYSACQLRLVVNDAILEQAKTKPAPQARRRPAS